MLPPSLQSPAIAKEVDEALAGHNIAELRCLLYLVRSPGEHRTAAIARAIKVGESHVLKVMTALSKDKLVTRRPVGRSVNGRGRPAYLWKLAA